MHREVVQTALEKISVLMQGISIVRPDLEPKDALGIAEKVADIISNFDGREAVYLLGRVLDSLGFQRKPCEQNSSMKPEDIDDWTSRTFKHKVQSNGNVVIPAWLVRTLFDIYGLDYINNLYVHYDPYDAFAFYITHKRDISAYSAYVHEKCSLCNELSIGFTNKAQSECMRRLRIKKEAVKKLFCGYMPKKAKFKLDTLPGSCGTQKLWAIKVNFEI